jgi:hypothetical protein
MYTFSERKFDAESKYALICSVWVSVKKFQLKMCYQKKIKYALDHPVFIDMLNTSEYIFLIISKLTLSYTQTNTAMFNFPSAKV